MNNEIQPFRCRALLDIGSSMNFITERLANSLKLNQRKCSVPIGTLNTLSTTSKRYITATITSIDGTYERTLTFLIIPTISSWVPNQPVDRSTIQIPRNLQLADPRFHKPAPIEILLSAGPTLASLCVGQPDISQTNGPDLRLQKTRFGWVIGGSPTSQSLAYAFNTFTRFTGGPRPFLGNRRRTANCTHFGSGTTVRGALSKSRSSHQLKWRSRRIPRGAHRVTIIASHPHAI